MDPVIAYRSKWPSTWTSYWFYHKVLRDESSGTYPLVKAHLELLSKTPSLDVEEKPEHQAFVAMLQQVSKVYGTRDITKKYIACRYWPLAAGWSITTWKGAIGGILQSDLSVLSCYIIWQSYQYSFCLSPDYPGPVRKKGSISINLLGLILKLLLNLADEILAWMTTTL